MNNHQSSPAKILKHGNLVIDSYAARVMKGTKEVALTAKEYLVLLFFARNMGNVISISDLLKSIWGRAGSNNKQVVYMTLSRLRKKIEDEPGNPIHIITLRNDGYIMLSEPPA
jgi:DNA-binding response OmpR family regulator